MGELSQLSQLSLSQTRRNYQTIRCPIQPPRPDASAFSPCWPSDPASGMPL